MVLYLNGYKKGMDDYFVVNCLPSIIATKMLGVCANKNTDAMDTYLKKLYGITTMYVVREVSKNIRTTWFGDNCQIEISPNVYEPKSNQKLKSLMKLVDIGNAEVKGLGILRETLSYVSHYLNTIYSMYIGLNSLRNKKEGS